MSNSELLPGFQALGLSVHLLKALAEVGYETPSPIQAKCIPLLLAGDDVLGQAQTGTGKTAAFALPLLDRIDLKSNKVQLLVLAPTRELAIQVAEAFQSYARHLPHFHVMPIYGGQGYDTQLRQLRRGCQVVVGTPGRVMDHIRRGSLVLDSLQALVLDEADEMLRMGFIDDVEWILEKTPTTRQIALFSATMPREIERVAQRYLRDPKTVKIEVRTTTAETIHQRYWRVSGVHKLDALTRILEAETFDAMLVFVRTKIATVDLAEKLSARGYACEALNGDIAQQQRERTVDRLKKGTLDILVATDVAARGLDVERISHVVNYDIPYDTEAYVHRIGRTGRAGRQGEAILFVADREIRMLRSIEKATGQTVEAMQLPSVADVNQQRLQKFKQKITEALESPDLSMFERFLADYQTENDTDPLRLAAALACLAQGGTPLLLSEKIVSEKKRESYAQDRDDHSARRDKRDARDRDRDRGDRDRGDRERGKPKKNRQQALPLKEHPDVKLQRYRIAVGHEQGVKPGNIVGAIANEAGIESEFIGHVAIFDNYSTVDLPEGMPSDVLRTLQKARVCGQPMAMEVDSGTEPEKREWKKKSYSDEGRKPDAAVKRKKPDASRNDGKKGDGKKTDGKKFAGKKALKTQDRKPHTKSRDA